MRWIAFLTALVGCGGSSAPTMMCNAADYPCGPYGYAQGSTIGNLMLMGQRDANGNGSAADDLVTTITLADYFHDANLQALVLIIGAEDCVPCQNEQPDLVTLDQKYGGKVAFLEGIVHAVGGAPATQATVDNWAMRYMLPFDLTHDPDQVLAPFYPANTFPSAMAIRLSDMQIVYKVTGPADGLQAALDGIVH